MEPVIFVIFGASGDLAVRKLIPALYALHKTDYLPEKFAVLGVSRTDFSDESFREKVVYGSKHISAEDTDNGSLKAFADKLHYISIDTKKESDYAKVKQRLEELDKQYGMEGNYIFYLSLPPNMYETVPAFLSAQGLNDNSTGYKRLVIEKPFGYDEQTARQLNEKLQEYFDEKQIYRIDHYLGKETVQNLLVTRFANGIFEPLWNRNYIHHIEITSAESIGVENRGGYYDESGALRDMVQNHLLQIVAHIAMEPPINADAKSIRDEKLKLFQSIRPIQEEDVPKFVIRGQYTSAEMDGEMVKGYREEKDVPKNSRTETYVALKFFIDNWRWADVPFYIRTGKRLPSKVTEIAVHFKSPPHHLFQSEKGMGQVENLMIIRIQPAESLALQFGMKVPGQGFRVKKVDMDFFYSDLTQSYVPEAYERLLLDVMKGDATLYSRGDSVEAAWHFVDPILNAWKNNPSIKVYGYPAGSWGPEVADELVDGHKQWHNPCEPLTGAREFQELK